MTDDSGAGYFRGLVTGLLFGAAAALLLAPRKGDELRHELAEGAVKLKDKVGSMSGTAAGSLEEAVDTVGDRAREIIDHGSEVLADARSALGDKVEGARKSMKKPTGLSEGARDLTHDVVESV